MIVIAIYTGIAIFLTDRYNSIIHATKNSQKHSQGIIEI